MSIAPIVKTIRIGLLPQAAFDLFTTRIGEWWPVESHSVSGNAGQVSQALTMTTGPGGEVVETGHDGARHVWGQIEEWMPGEAFAMTWHPGRTDGVQTRVRVVFEADGDGTRVTLTHSDWENLGDEASKTRDGYDKGWNGVLARFEEAETA